MGQDRNLGYVACINFQGSPCFQNVQFVKVFKQRHQGEFLLAGVGEALHSGDQVANFQHHSPSCGNGYKLGRKDIIFKGKCQ